MLDRWARAGHRRLVDKLTGDAIANQKVEVTIGASHRYATTGPDGGFSTSVPSEPGTQQILLSYGGSARSTGPTT